MHRLNEENINTPELSDQIFEERWRSLPHWMDSERWLELAKYFKTGKYLDVACFNSPIPWELSKKKDVEIHAVDHAPNVIKKMQEYFPEVHYKLSDITTLPYNHGEFDYVVSGETIEHMEDPEAHIDECMRVLRPGGVFAISTPLDDMSISTEHLWGFELGDIEEMLQPHGHVKSFVYEKQSFPILFAWCQKYDRSQSPYQLVFEEN